ncbi:hypothetical protein THMIRHAS_08400 [Thiosulfatimonas sediminis]|uniref:PilZ domain-containing protein n=1 Tax=Thiosulfatimonas sediminis TaxID=2675054 RepID=A0A6F8PTW0_9GAMM|nr:hypothetical protein [Thiosulfatimonas sediminis]BBP45467.1 hypothetical protein THMIRHAS_08400 [Thiosulfatimonas sediminis]
MESRVNRIAVHLKGVLEKRKITGAAVLKDVSVDGSGLSLLSNAVLLKGDHIVFELSERQEGTVHCVVRIVHQSKWQGENYYGCMIVYKNKAFDEMLTRLNQSHTRQGNSRFGFLSSVGKASPSVKTTEAVSENNDDWGYLVGKDHLAQQ